MNLLDDAHEHKRNEIIARQLGLTSAELSEADFMIEQDTNEDGEAYRTYVKFYNATPQEVLDKIENLDENKEVDLDMTAVEERDFDSNKNFDGERYDKEDGLRIRRSV